MIQVLLYRDRESLFNDDKLIQSLKENFSDFVFCSRDLDSFKKSVQAGKVQVILLLAQNTLSKELEEFFLKSKNQVNLHETVVILLHAKLSGPDAQRSLLLGANYVYHNPINIEYLTKLLRHHVYQEELHSSPVFTHFTVPVYSALDTFGRIGWIEKKSPWDICVETSVDLAPGDKVSLHHLQALDLKQKSFSYEVKQKTSRGLYYRYSFQYRLKWLDLDRHSGAMETWLQKNSGEFSVPKIKVLFVLSERNAHLIHNFSSTLFSPYLIDLSHFNEQALLKIDPQILVQEPGTELQEQFVLQWKNAHLENRRDTFLLQETLPLETKDADSFRKDFLNRVEQFVRDSFKSVNSQYSVLSRNSAYSRFALSCEAEIWALSQHHLLLRANRSFSPGTVLQVHLENSQKNDPILLLKVDSSELQGNRYKIVCSICFLSEEQRKYILNIGVPKDKGGDQEREQNFLAEKDRIAFLYDYERNRKLRLLYSTLAVAITLVFFGLLLLAFIRQPKTKEKEIKSGDTYYDSFQKSVKKAFGFEGDTNSK